MAARKKLKAPAAAAGLIDVGQSQDIPMGLIHVLRSGKVVVNPADNWLGCWGDFVNAVERGKALLTEDEKLEFAAVKG